MDEELLLELLAQILRAQPEVNRDGEIQPFDLEYQKDVLNMFQDQADLLADPTFLLTQPGSYDPAAFAPVVDEVIERELPTRPKIESYLRGDPMSISTQIAQAIANGGTPEGAIEVMKSTGLITEGDFQAEESALDLARGLFDEQVSFDSEMAKLPRDGQGQPVLREERTRPSDAAQQFIDAGLPLPTDRWRDTDFAPNIDRRRAEYESAIGEQRLASEALRALQREQRALRAPAPDTVLGSGIPWRDGAEAAAANREALANYTVAEPQDYDPEVAQRRLDQGLPLLGELARGRAAEDFGAAPDRRRAAPLSEPIMTGGQFFGRTNRDPNTPQSQSESQRSRARIEYRRQKQQRESALAAQIERAERDRRQANEKSSRKLRENAYDIGYANTMRRVLERRGESPFQQAMLARAQGLRRLGL